ncbi:ATPase, T2SS/T4P/T4SS family [Lacticaseibacillus brantae]|uniref:Type II secretory pathway competence component,AtPase n=1 Tax=Lacticaseibacillus brantae DSM 23927 TaxID=1423727 RepID=A0A0R2BBM9_9LACO|nr:ATPase, T2SS/T4P/T4SS family [Lacticaseibacillus brantae]KRM73059.1 type II secretory pathway competence component,AtPase [Lacticaseibacillus brantae DSM 23927]
MDELWQLLLTAIAQRASDVYVLPGPVGYRLSFRMPTGIGAETQINETKGDRWINYLKFRAGMNVAEHRRVQGGAFYADEIGMALRLSTVGDYHEQESLVIRLIAGIPPISVQQQASFLQMQHLLGRRGLFVLSGPTGSGKTTLLYQLAETLVPAKMVMSIEDPVEIDAPDFLQLQVNAAAEMSYGQLVKAALRHRPDCLIIGEIRDRETASVACEAAISGHIVLTTVHARHPLDVPLRLMSLGVNASLVAAAVTVTAAVSLMSEETIYPQVDLWTWKDGEATHEIS